jgi:hypothetical protein
MISVRRQLNRSAWGITQISMEALRCAVLAYQSRPKASEHAFWLRKTPFGPGARRWCAFLGAPRNTRDQLMLRKPTNCRRPTGIEPDRDRLTPPKHEEPIRGAAREKMRLDHAARWGKDPESAASVRPGSQRSRARSASATRTRGPLPQMLQRRPRTAGPWLRSRSGRGWPSCRATGGSRSVYSRVTASGSARAVHPVSAPPCREPKSERGCDGDRALWACLLPPA